MDCLSEPPKPSSFPSATRHHVSRLLHFTAEIRRVSEGTGVTLPADSGTRNVPIHSWETTLDYYLITSSNEESTR